MQISNFLFFLYREFVHKLNIWTLSSLLSGILIFIPIGLVIYNINNFTSNWEHIINTVLSNYLFNSIVLLLGTVLFSVILGVSSAWIVTSYKFPGCQLFKWLLILPLAIPTYISAYAYFDILDLFNPVLLWIKLNISLSAMNTTDTFLVYLMTTLVMSSVLYPYIYLLARSSFESQGNHFTNVSRSLGYSKYECFWKIVLPLSRPAIVAGISLVIMETLSDYGAVKHFGIQTFTYGIFRTWLGMGDLTSALRLAVVLMVFTLSILYIEKRNRSNAQYIENSLKKSFHKKNSLNGLKSILAIIFCLLPLFLGFIFPVLRLGYWALLSKSYFLELNILKLSFNTLLLSFLTSIFTVTISVFFVFSAKYFKNSIVKMTNKIAILGYSTPGAVIAMGTLILVGYISNLTGLVLSGTIFFLIFAYIVRFLAVAFQPIEAGMEKNCDKLNDAAKLLGAKPFYSFYKINIPILKNSVIAAALLVFIDATKELPLTLILRPFNFETLATATFDLSNQAQIIESSIPSISIISLVVIPIIYLNRRIGMT